MRSLPFFPLFLLFFFCFFSSDPSFLFLFDSRFIDPTRVHSPAARPNRYFNALQDQPRVRLLPAPLDTLLPAALFAFGQTLVVTSTWALGVTGTFLGDYFGILMDHRVEGFPFNVLRDPMYVGSTMCFAATALWCVPLLALLLHGMRLMFHFCRYERPIGLLITLYVYVAYTIALKFEGYATFSCHCVRSADAAKAVHRHDLLHAVNVCQKIVQ